MSAGWRGAGFYPVPLVGYVQSSPHVGGSTIARRTRRTAAGVAATVGRQVVMLWHCYTANVLPSFARQHGCSYPYLAMGCCPRVCLSRPSSWSEPFSPTKSKTHLYGREVQLGAACAGWGGLPCRLLDNCVLVFFVVQQLQATFTGHGTLSPTAGDLWTTACAFLLGLLQIPSSLSSV